MDLSLKIFISGIFLASLLFVPLVTGEFFPYSSHSMFADTHREYWQIEFKDRNGRVIPPELFNLQLNYRGLPESQAYGLTPKFSYLNFGKRLVNSEILPLIELKRETHKELFPITMIHSRYGQNSRGQFETLEQEEMSIE